MIASIEKHVEWIGDLLAHMHKTGQVRVEAEEAAETEWVKYNYDIATDSLVMKANSWYLGANVPGKPRVFMPMPAASPPIARSARASPRRATAGSALPTHRSVRAE